MVIARHVSMTASRVRSCNRSTSLSLSVPKNNRLIPFAMVNANANATFANATTLIFDVDLLSIKGKEQAATKPATPATPNDLLAPAPAEPKQVVTSDIIKVPSAEEMKKGAKIEVIKKEDLEAEIEKAKQIEKEAPAPKADEKE